MSGRNHKKVPQKNYWKTILNKFAAPNSYIRDWSSCKYNTICLCRQEIETKENHQTNTFLILESKNWFTSNCERWWRWSRLQHQQPQLIKKALGNIKERSKTTSRILQTLERVLLFNSREARKSRIIPRTKSWTYLSSKGKFPHRNLKSWMHQRKLKVERLEWKGTVEVRDNNQHLFRE